ncbi:hypothetical protein T439DRAFT_325897 [Meredithblackwellia eburnea MCA 4105]
MEECQTQFFQNPTQFWSELQEIINIPPSTSSLDELDYALTNYVTFASAFMDQFLTTPTDLDTALHLLLSSPVFKHHQDRMTSNLLLLVVSPTTSPSSLFVVFMLILHMGLADPESKSREIGHASFVGSASASSSGAGGGGGGVGKVFKAMRKRWGTVVPVLIDCVVNHAGVVEQSGGHEHERAREREGGRPRDGWEERLGTTATVVLYEVCRVQRLGTEELALFTIDFIQHLFTLVERTRDAEDETFNYSLIKLIIALNEQFMVSSLPPPPPATHSSKHHHHHGHNNHGNQNGDSGGGNLPPPILPNVVHGNRPRDPNLVLEVLRMREGDSKTFGENIIFILNRSNGSPDSLCVSLLILKILYLLFTTTGTHEYFYTNDLCVLVDVFIRELNDLGDESEGLKHTYLRVLHPLLTNTQLRHHPYKRPLLRRVLNSLITPSVYRTVDSTTRRLVERNLRGSWCEGLTDESVGEGERRANSRKASLLGPGGEERSVMGLGWSSGMGALREQTTGSTLSVDVVAHQGEVLHHHQHSNQHPHHQHHKRKPSWDSTKSSPVLGNRSTDSLPLASAAIAIPGGVAGGTGSVQLVQSPSSGTGSPLSSSITLEPVTEVTTPPPAVEEHRPEPPVRRRSHSLFSPKPYRPATTNITDSPRSTSPSSTSSSSSPSPQQQQHTMMLSPPSPPVQRAMSTGTDGRRRRPPPPPTESISRPRTPVINAPLPVPTPSPGPGQRRAAPEPPSHKSRVASGGAAAQGRLAETAKALERLALDHRC